ncbi:hypothetical protein ACS8YF_04400 [Salinisphaera sp. SWV1]|uniref:hypothetical protein n=1 Tax=Salinisphaera sp. SWV1 TaxID=3454139 RepID=UPI003F86A6DB
MTQDKAFHVQADEYGAVVFARSHVVARRQGAEDLDTEFGEVSCLLPPLFSKPSKIKAGACPSFIFKGFAANGRGEHAVACSRY